MTHPFHLNCELHDYLEIACTFEYQVILSLRSGEQIVGRCVTTSAQNGEEFLLFRCAGELRRIALQELGSMRVQTPKALFQKVDFH